jgi:hypothetical protein
MLGGFVGDVPAVDDADSYPTQILYGTSDTRDTLKTDNCARQRPIAETYAAKYNAIIVQATRN